MTDRAIETQPQPDQGAPDGPRNLVYISDGTLSSFKPGEETNAGLLFRLLCEIGPRARQFVEYDPGIQGQGTRKWWNAVTGMGINATICRGYAYLAAHYRPGDRIFLFGYSRGAYAVRSLAGMIGRVGLLRREEATERHVRLAFRYYEMAVKGPVVAGFTARRCHTDVPIEMLGAWDTVKALGLPYPVLSRMAAMATEFHDHRLGDHIRHGYHALALDENRTAFCPIKWSRSEDWAGRLEQTWFPGTHADVGGEVRYDPAARPLANIPLNWMLRRATRHGLILPGDWEARFPEDPAAPSIGTHAGIGKFFLFRAPRVVGGGDGEAIHLSMVQRRAAVPGYAPAARIGDEDTPIAENGPETEDTTAPAGEPTPPGDALGDPA